jgi:hypothetical protein
MQTYEAPTDIGAFSLLNHVCQVEEDDNMKNWSVILVVVASFLLGTLWPLILLDGGGLGSVGRYLLK